MSQKVQEERERERKRQREENEEEAFEFARRLKEDEELKTLLQIADEEQNPEAARDKILNEVYHYALVFDFLACYMHSEHGFDSPMMFDTDKRRLKEMNPKFKIPLKVESDM
jgi:hypothetical protein